MQEKGKTILISNNIIEISINLNGDSCMAAFFELIKQVFGIQSFCNTFSSNEILGLHGPIKSNISAGSSQNSFIYKSINTQISFPIILYSGKLPFPE